MELNRSYFEFPRLACRFGRGTLWIWPPKEKRRVWRMRHPGNPIIEQLRKGKALPGNPTKSTSGDDTKGGIEA